MQAKLLLLVFRGVTLKEGIAKIRVSNPDDDGYCGEDDSVTIAPTDVVGINSSRWIQGLLAGNLRLKALPDDTLVRLPLADGLIRRSANGEPLMFTTATAILLATHHAMNIHNDEDRLEQYLGRLEDSSVILYWC